MLRYLLKRILYLLPTLLGVNLLVFAMFFVVNSPDDMAKQFLGEKASTPEQIERWKASRGYDLPLCFNRNARGFGKVTRTILWRKSIALFWGDFGNTDHSGVSIRRELSHRVLPSFALALPVFLITLFINVVLAMKLAGQRGTAFDTAGQFLCVVLMSISTLLFIIFGQYLIP